MARTIEAMHIRQVSRMFPEMMNSLYPNECVGMLADETNHAGTLPAMIISAQLNWDKYYKHCGVTVTTNGVCHKCGTKIPVIQRPKDWTDLKEFVDPSLRGDEKKAAYTDVKKHIRMVCAAAESLGRTDEQCISLGLKTAPKTVKQAKARVAKLTVKKDRKPRQPRVSYWDKLCAKKSGKVVSYVQV